MQDLMSLRQGVAAPPPCAGVHRACASPYCHATQRAVRRGSHSPVSFVKSSHAHQCRECPAEAAPYAGTLPSSLAMACGVRAGGSGSLPSIYRAKPRATRTIATQHKHRARPWPSRSFTAIPSASWRGTGTRRAQARRAAKESTLWRAPWTTSDMAPSFIELS